MSTEEIIALRHAGHDREMVGKPPDEVYYAT